MKQLEEIRVKEKESKVYKLKKVMYGFKQGQWLGKIDHYPKNLDLLVQLKFKKIDVNFVWWHACDKHQWKTNNGIQNWNAQSIF